MTYENALNGISEVLLGKGHHGGGEEGGRGDPVVQAEDPAVDADFVEVGESTDLAREGSVSPITSLELYLSIITKEAAAPVLSTCSETRERQKRNQLIKCVGEPIPDRGCRGRSLRRQRVRHCLNILSPFWRAVNFLKASGSSELRRSSNGSIVLLWFPQTAGPVSALFDRGRPRRADVASAQILKVHWISVSTWDLGLEEIHAISDFAL